jgi:hypothetical protein
VRCYIIDNVELLFSMSRPKSSPLQATSTTSLALSSLHIHLEALEKEHKWLLKHIKRKRTELKNFVEQMRSLATEIFQRSVPSFKKQADLDQEIHSLFDEIFSKRKFGKQTKKEIEGIYLHLQLMGIISPKPDNSKEATENEPFENNEQEPDFFGSSQQHHHQDRQAQHEPEFCVGGRNDESRKIRQTFLRLAEIFHPDKAVDKSTQISHTEIMKEINKAYQEGDLARLLEIEQQHQAGESIDRNSQDDLTRKCTHLEQQNEFLKTQYETLKRELAGVKHTPEGMMVSSCRKAVKVGIDPIAQMIEQVESEIKVIIDLRNFIKDFRDQKITIKEFLQGPVAFRKTDEEMAEDFLKEMFGDLGEIVFF